MFNFDFFLFLILGWGGFGLFTSDAFKPQAGGGTDIESIINQRRNVPHH